MLTALMVFCLTVQAADDNAKAETLERLEVLTQKGIGLFKAKEYEKALGVFQEAEKLMPENPTTAYNIACAYSLLGKKKEAFESLFKSISLGYLNLAYMNADEDLAPLRGEKEWKDIEARVKEEIARREAEMAKKAREEMKKALGVEKPLFPFKFALKDVEGNALESSAFRGKALIVDIWGTWCPPCRRAIPHLIALHNKYKEKGLAIVGLSRERGTPEQGAKAVREYIKTSGINYPCGLIDGELLEQIPDFRAFPTLLFIDREGNVRMMRVGYSPEAVLDAYIAEFLGATGDKPEQPAKKEKKNRWFAR